MAFEPSDGDRAFLQAYLSAKPGERVERICRRAKLGAKWYYNRRASSTEFCRWFYNEVLTRWLPRLLGVMDRTLLILEGRTAEMPADLKEDVKNYRIDANLLKMMKEWLDPSITRLDIKMRGQIEHVDRPMDRADVLRGFVSFCEEAARYKICGECGAPRVRWDLWRQGLDDGEDMMLEDKRHGEVIEAEGHEIEQAARVDQ